MRKKSFFSVWKPIRAIKSWLHLIYVSISISSSQTYHPHCYDVSIHDHNVMINNNHYKVKYKLQEEWVENFKNNTPQNQF